jgi:outer membrane protein assembly factor BamB
VVVALPSDGVVQAFDAASGEARWSVRLREATRQLVRVDDMVGALDAREEDSSEAALFLYRAGDGELVRAIEPSCQQNSDGYTDYAHYYDPVLSDGRGGLYWLLDSAACLLRFEGASGELSWQAFDERFASALNPSKLIFADGTFYMGYSNQLVAVSEQGAPQLISEEEDYNLTPLAARSGSLLALAERTRGTRRYEIWAIDPASGERRWAHVLSASDPIENFYDSGDFAVNIVGEAVVIVEQSDEPEQISFSRLGLADGAVQLSVPLAVEEPDDYLRGATWGQSTLWLAIDELYGVDLSSGALSYRWP